MAHSHVIKASYFEALGRFVHTFAVAERQVLQTLARLAGLKPLEAHALLSGVRADNACNLIKRLLDTRNLPDTKARLGEFLEQFVHINRARNDILHYGTSVDANNQLVVFKPAHLRDLEKVRPISELTINAMTMDLERIYICLALFNMRDTEIPDQWASHQAVGRAWQYTPPEQASQRQKSQRNPPKRKRQRDA